MKEKELRQYATCSMCGKKIGESGMPMFWRIVVERHGIKLDAVSRQQGLTMMLGGHATIAMAMGADEEMTMPLIENHVLSICETCATESTCIGRLAELPSVIPSKEDEK